MTSVFFFSSRRRHTRWPRDWSSDVCSSDLSHLHRLFRNVFSAAPKIVKSRLIPEPKAKKAEKSTGNLLSSYYYFNLYKLQLGNYNQNNHYPQPIQVLQIQNAINPQT